MSQLTSEHGAVQPSLKQFWTLLSLLVPPILTPLSRNRVIVRDFRLGTTDSEGDKLIRD